MSEVPTRDAGPADTGAGEQATGVNSAPGPGVHWENTPTHDAGVWIAPPAGPEDLVFVSEAELAVNWAEWLDVTLSVLPVVGTVKDIVEAVTGRSLITDEDLDTLERVMAVVGALGTVGGAVSRAAGGHAADAAAEAVTRADAVREATEGWERSEATLDWLDAVDRARAAFEATDHGYDAVGRVMSKVGDVDTVADWVALVSQVAEAVVGDGVPDDGEDGPAEFVPGPDGAPAADDDVCYAPADDEPTDESVSYPPADDEPDLDPEEGGPAADPDESVSEPDGASPTWR